MEWLLHVKFHVNLKGAQRQRASLVRLLPKCIVCVQEGAMGWWVRGCALGSRAQGVLKALGARGKLVGGAA